MPPKAGNSFSSSGGDNLFGTCNSEPNPFYKFLPYPRSGKSGYYNCSFTDSVWTNSLSGRNSRVRSFP